MKRASLLLVLLPLMAAQATFAVAGPGAVVRQQEEQPPPTPLEDPYVPPAGDPDIFAPDPSETPSPLNPQGD